MQPVTEKDLMQMIEESRKAGKDVSELENELKKMKKKVISPPMGEKKEKKLEKGTRVIESTGPAREEDFND